MPLLTVTLVCLLLSSSDEIAITGILLVFASTMCVTFAIFGTTLVEERIGKRRMDWPKNTLKRGTLYWGVAVLVFVAQLSTIVRDFGIPNIYETLFWGGLALCGIAGFESYLMFRFIMNPQYQPQVNLVWVWLCLMFGVIDTMTIYFLISLYPTFAVIPVVGKIFAILLIPSFVCSILYLWATWKGKSTFLVKIAYVLAVSPYVFLIALLFVAYALMMV